MPEPTASHPTEVPRLAAGVPYTYATVVPKGQLLVFTAGACPLDATGETVGPGDVAAQATQVMDNLELALLQAQATLSDVVKTTVFVATTSREDLLQAWDVVHGRFGDHEPPSTLLGVSALGWPGQLVEVEAVAAIQDGDEKIPG